MDGSSKKAELTSMLIQDLAPCSKRIAGRSTQLGYSSALNFIFPLCLSGGASPPVNIPTHAACSCRFCTKIYKLLLKPCFSGSSEKICYKKGRRVNTKFNAE